MKKVTAYVNTNRVHWLVDELGTVGVEDIMVTEFFSPTSSISRMELLCEDAAVERIRALIHRLGTTGSPCDHYFAVSDFDPMRPGRVHLGRRMSRLEE